MRIAIIADIHGNLLALDAVLADIAARGIAQIVNLGDIVSGPLWPRETLDRLADIPMPTVRGNHDRWVSEGDAATLGASDTVAYQQLSAAQRAALGALPATLDLGDGIFAFHATPDDDNRYLVEVVRGGVLVPRQRRLSRLRRPGRRGACFRSRLAARALCRADVGW
jgi:3',5'-cyclic AMP phosphodiesterase CpdA